MKWKKKQTDSEHIIVNHIELTRGPVMVLSCVLVVAALLVYLTLAGERAAASETGTAGEASSAQSTGMCQFYLTKGEYHGNQALTACAPGYHMASIWEIADPSNLKYNTVLGQTIDDSGQGAVASYIAWVRTGYAANLSETTPGKANCGAWSSGSGLGTFVWLHPQWTDTSDYAEDVGVWSVGAGPCMSSNRVWCIED